MSFFDEFTLGSPAVLWALFALPGLVMLFFTAERKRRKLLGKLIAARLQPRLAGTVSVAKRRVSFALLVAALFLALLALARPQWGFTWEEQTMKGRDILLAIDTSRSMLAQDPKPNRLVRARLAAQDLLALIEGDRVGLIAFAGSSFLQAPLTADFSAVKDSLNELDTEIIPRGGTNLKAAIEAANDAFGKGESEHRALIIFTDGEELEEDAKAAAAEHASKFRIFTVGLGSPQGGLIPVQNERGGTDFVRDDQGQYVTSRLDEKRLQEVAEASGGFYVHLQNGFVEMNRIVSEGLGKMKEHESDSRYSKKPIERYPWPLAAAVACFVVSLLIGERKRAALLGRAAAAAFMVLGAQARAADVGEARYAQKDYKGALESYEAELQRRDAPELQYNAGNAAFQLGDFNKAAASFSKALGTGRQELQARAAYNLGNSLAKRGAAEKERDGKIKEWTNAIQHYDRAIELDPKNEDAAYNRGLVKKALEVAEEEKKQEEQQKKDDEKKDDEKKDGEKKDGEKKDGEKEDGEKKDGEKKDGEKKDGEKKDGEKKDGDAQKPGEKKDGNEKQQPKPEPAEQGEKKSGELKAANDEPKGDKNDEAAEAAEAAAAAKEGRMTEKDAKLMLEAMRKFDERVRLLDPREAERRVPMQGFRNW